MPALLSLLLPALVPVASDAIRGIVGRLTGGSGAQPQNVAEAIQLMQAETERLRAVAELDKPAENISKWVANVRASARYFMAFFILLLTGVAILAPNVPVEYVDMLIQVSSSVFSFLFGDRMYLHLKKK